MITETEELPKEVGRSTVRRRAPSIGGTILKVAEDTALMDIVRQQADQLSDDDVQYSVWWLRFLLLKCGHMAPAGETLRDQALSLVRLSWLAVPASLAEPRPGTLYFVRGEDGEVSRCGVVTKQFKNGAEVDPARFMGIDSVTGRVRKRSAEVDFWIVPPGG
jgi:hypothetical protein